MQALHWAGDGAPRAAPIPEALRAAAGAGRLRIIGDEPRLQTCVETQKEDFGVDATIARPKEAGYLVSR